MGKMFNGGVCSLLSCYAPVKMERDDAVMEKY